MEDKLKEALKKDFQKLYVKQFTTNWREERIVRDIEIDVMSLHNLMYAIDPGYKDIGKTSGNSTNTTEEG